MSIRRGGATLIPGGDTALAAGDALTIVTTPDAAPQVEATLTG